MSRSHETIIEINATPDEVFSAITEPEQIVKWFAPEARIEPRVGGKYIVSWGPGMEGSSLISAWVPPAHFAAYRDRSFTFGNPPVDTGVTQRIAVDYYIEAIGGGITRLRLVQSGFGPEAAWDGEFESTRTGWEHFLKKLKEVLES